MDGITYGTQDENNNVTTAQDFDLMVETSEELNHVIDEEE